MSVFGEYASYYDILYRDKNYAKESQFVHDVIQVYASATESILDLGCGTGIHAMNMSKKGYQVQGIDISRDMLAHAKAHKAKSDPRHQERLNFSYGDIRKIRLNQKFDAITSLFHAVSYQISNEDLKETFDTVRMHLKPGGLFIFDCWYGPAVLMDPPTDRIKRLETADEYIIRIAEPVSHVNENTIDVHYQMIVQNKKSNAARIIKEVHCMRYLFKKEIELLLDLCCLELLGCFEWMTNQEPSGQKWDVYFIVRG